MRSRIFTCLLLIVATVLLLPAAASAVTVDEIVALARAGVSDSVILAVIDRDKTIFGLDTDQLLSLKAEGLSEPVILAMLKSGREEGDRAAQAESDLKTAMYLAERSAEPEVAVIGHGPGDVPYAPAANGYSAAPYYFRAVRRALRRSLLSRQARRPCSVRTIVPLQITPGAMFRQSRFAPATPAANIPVIPPSNIPVIPPVSGIQSRQR